MKVQKTTWKKTAGKHSGIKLPQNMSLFADLHRHVIITFLPPICIRSLRPFWPKYNCFFLIIPIWKNSTGLGFWYSFSSQISSGCKITAGTTKENMLHLGYQIQQKNLHLWQCSDTLFSGEQIYRDTKRCYHLSYLHTYKSYERMKFYMNTLILSLLLTEKVSMTPPSLWEGEAPLPCKW